MLKFNGLEHHDDFDDEIICWVDVSGVPERFVREAEDIDGENYSSDCFGVCLLYDKDKKAFTAIEDRPGAQLYYIDNDGDKHWLSYPLNETEIRSIAQKVKPIIEQARTE